MGSAVHHDTLIVANGDDENNRVLSSSEYFIAATNKWNPISSMTQKRWGNILAA